MSTEQRESRIRKRRKNGSGDCGFVAVVVFAVVLLSLLLTVTTRTTTASSVVVDADTVVATAASSGAADDDNSASAAAQQCDAKQEKDGTCQNPNAASSSTSTEGTAAEGTTAKAADAVAAVECGLFLAPSTIPGAGLGIFTGRAKDVGDSVSHGDICIPFVDMYWCV